MNHLLFDDLRNSGHVVVDFPRRKIAVYANTSGHVVLMCQEVDVEVCQLVTPDEIGELCAALMRAGKEAKPIADSIDADFEAFTAISKEQVGAS